MRQMPPSQCHACRRVCAYEWRRRWEKAVQNRGFFPHSGKVFPPLRSISRFPTFSHLIFFTKRGGKSEVRSQPRHKTSGCAWTRKSEKRPAGKWVQAGRISQTSRICPRKSLVTRFNPLHFLNKEAMNAESRKDGRTRPEPSGQAELGSNIGKLRVRHFGNRYGKSYGFLRESPRSFTKVSHRTGP